MGIEEGVGAIDLGGEEEGRGGGEPMDIMETISPSLKLVDLLRRFLLIQQRRAQAYAKLQRGFNEYMIGGAELAYQQLCGEVTLEFNDCSKQVIEIESMLLLPDYCRSDLANLLKDVQMHEKKKLHLTAKIQLLKKSGRPSEHVASHECCRCSRQLGNEHAHAQGTAETTDLEDSEADAACENALKEAIKGVQDAVTSINDHLEEVRYEIEALVSG